MESEYEAAGRGSELLWETVTSGLLWDTDCVAEAVPVHVKYEGEKRQDGGATRLGVHRALLH